MFGGKVMSKIVGLSGQQNFRDDLDAQINQYLTEASQRFPQDECLRMDLHCHDKNSDIPDELWGRILGLPETWLKTKHLMKTLSANNCDAFTVTNHNNARSCWKLLEQGQDVVVGAEFTCIFPEYTLYVHVLAYGFTREQETEMNRLRRNLYDFLRYCHKNNLPVILPHPLYFYTKNDAIDFELFEKMAVIFQRFEVMNGQRDKWQTALTLSWLTSLTPEKIKHYAQKHCLSPEEFGVDPDRPKVLCGGSDDHMGLFAGQCGSYLHVPNLKERLKTEKPSQLALEAIREGRIAPYGQVYENQKLNIALLDYFAQIVNKMKDPGLLRLMLHQGSISDKAACFVIGNLFLEMQKHKKTAKFFKMVHEALRGKKPTKLMKWAVSKKHRIFIEKLEQIAQSKHQSVEHYVSTVNSVIAELFTHLNQLIINKVKKQRAQGNSDIFDISTEALIRRFEIPMQLSTLFFGGEERSPNVSSVNYKDMLEHLTFPILMLIVLTGVFFASTRLLYQNREFLNQFAHLIKRNKHHQRALYLTDTLFDKNGVSKSLSVKLMEVQRVDMPIDFLVCHESADAQSHLHVVRPLTEFSLPIYPEQSFRVPDLMEIVRIFYEGGYDRIVCSTEGPLAIVALFLKEMFNVPAFFKLHTNWFDFIKEHAELNRHEEDRIRRFLRFFYRQFTGLLVLNGDHQAFLSSQQMQLSEASIQLSVNPTQRILLSDQKKSKAELLGEDIPQNSPVLFYAGRLSKEKGVFHLRAIYEEAKKRVPGLRLVIAGDGPDRAALLQLLPEAIYLGWKNEKELAELYQGLDLLVFPSKNDTFGNVIIEAMSYGMPAIAFNSKGPKDIITHGSDGFLQENTEEFVASIQAIVENKGLMKRMKAQAMQSARAYSARQVMRNFARQIGLDITSGIEVDAGKGGGRSVA